MLKKERFFKTVGCLIFVLIGTLLFFMACSGRSNQVQKNSDSSAQRQQAVYDEEDPVISLATGWGIKSAFTFQSPSVLDFLNDNDIKIGIFISDRKKYHFFRVIDFEEGIEIAPCLAENEELPGTCESLKKGAGFRYKGKDSIQFLKSKKNPPCVAVSIGGYLLEYNPLTGGPCS